MATTIATIKSQRNLRVCRYGKCWIFLLLEMHLRNTNLKQSYETKFKQKFKLDLKRLQRQSYATKVYKKPSIVKKLFIVCITFKTDVANFKRNTTSLTPAAISL